ncbi:TraB/VirB10 family protein (plasmid) [Burkholderia aenigmatica]|uniref:TraB/VirB10 family protein n=1 Tax=Burkholderia aenigmatica TaxID=2015348 RepID=UPI003B432345
MKLIDNVLRTWKLADATKKRRYIVTGAGVLIILLFFLMTKASKKPAPAVDPTLDVSVVAPPKRNTDLESLAAALTGVQRQLQELNVHAGTTDQQMTQLQQNFANRINEVATGKLTDKNLQAHIDDSIDKAVQSKLDKERAMGAPGMVGIPGAPGSNLNAPGGGDPSYPALPLGPAAGADGASSTEPARPRLRISSDDESPAGGSGGKGGAAGVATGASGAVAPIKTSFSGNPNAPSVDRVNNGEANSSDQTWLPAGGMFSGVLINGMDAPASQASQRQPTPVLIRVKKDAILPNFYTADVKECFVLASGYGSMATERAYMRTERLTCIRKDKGVIEVALDGYITGEDGKVGMRGRLVSKEGAVIARSLAAGFIGAFGQGLSTGLSGASQYGGFSISGGQKMPMSTVIRDAAGQGVGNALDRVANFYLDIAKEIVPVVEIDAGRQADIILVHGVSLKMGQH